jgi:hypothetical protein
MFVVIDEHRHAVWRATRAADGYNWRGFRELIEQFRIPRPRIVGTAKDGKGSFDGSGQNAAASVPEELGAGKPHAGACPELVEGICAGVVRQLAVLRAP